MHGTRLSRAASIVVLSVIYLLTLGVSIAIGHVIPLESPLLKAAVVDGIATVLVFLFSRGFDNSSMYDPYWSVAPIVIAGYWISAESAVTPFSPRAALLFALVAIWGVRLTYNFLKHWRGMHHEDWRYADFRVSAKRIYWLVSFVGFHVVPTAVVFLACVPMYYAVTSPSALHWLDGIAAAITGLAILIETVADAQMRRHSRQAPGLTFRQGLWAYSRHPNYFGEILFWWGLFLFAVAADPGLWWTVFGPAAVTVLFLTISLPLIEKRMRRRRSDYDRIKEEISILIPWFPKSPGNHR